MIFGLESAPSSPTSALPTTSAAPTTEVNPIMEPSSFSLDHGFSFKPLPLKKYDGRRDVDTLEAFLNGFEVLMKLSHVDNDQTKIQIFSLHLEGDALRWFLGVFSTHPNGFPLWNDFLEEFRNVFMPPGFKEDLVRRFMALRQQKDVFNYAVMFQQLLGRLPPHWISEDAAIERFLSGLKTQTQLQTRLTSHISLSDAIVNAQRVDSILFSKPKTNRFQQVKREVPAWNHTGYSSSTRDAEGDVIMSNVVINIFRN